MVVARLLRPLEQHDLPDREDGDGGIFPFGKIITAVPPKGRRAVAEPRAAFVEFAVATLQR